MPASYSPGQAEVDPLTCCEVVIPISFPAELNLSFNCVSVTSSSATSSSNLSSPASSYNEGGAYGGTSGALNLSSRDSVSSVSTQPALSTLGEEGDYTECDLDWEDVDFDEFIEGELNSTFVSSSTSESTRGFSSGGSGKESGSEGSSKRARVRSRASEDSAYHSLENPNPAPCIHCQDGKDHSVSRNLVWPIQLDVDLIETLVELCPQFFEDFDEVEMDPMDLSGSPQASSLQEDPSSTSGDSGALGSASPSQPSPPYIDVDDSPLQQSMDRNKESLKVKLLLRRPMNQLVEQGILPPPKTPPLHYGQRVKLERARMGDMLKAKIQQRPARQELIRQHILEDSNARVAPSLAEKQRMLKRARLADSLNDHLIHRPGPLELVKKNILHAPDAIIDQAIKEGVVPFKATSEGHIPGPHVPDNIYLSEDDSSSDLSSPAGTPDQSQSSSSFEVPPKGVPVPLTVLPPFPALPPPPPPLPPAPSTIQHIQNQLLSKIVKAAVTSSTTPPVTSAQLTLSKLSKLEHQQLLSGIAASGHRNSLPQTNSYSQQHSSSSKSRSSKKSSKSKTQPKARQIKFHEYKGPPSATKGQPQFQQQEVETSYELLLQQQQLFLQWQLECRHKVRKYPQIILPAVSKLSSPTEVAGTLASAVSAAAAASMHPTSLLTGTPFTSPSPNVLSPSSIASVTNSGCGPSNHQPIAPAPAPPITVQALVEKYNKNSNGAVPTPVPLKVMVSSSTSSSLVNHEIRPKLIPTKSILETVPTVSPTGSPAKLTSVYSWSKLNDWKVSDLRAELKKRNLPVSGSKPQLIERLKSADLSLQDESISTTTSSSVPNGGDVPKSSSITTSACTTIKSEVSMGETTTPEMMDVSESQTQPSAVQPSPQAQETVKFEGLKNTSNVAALNAAMLTLLQKNNFQNNGVIPVHVLNALANVTKNANVNSGSGQPLGNGKTQNIVVVDEKVLREQQKQIEHLQQELQNSQQEIHKMKMTQQGVPGQAHRQLQQHLQNKMQQQALQAQLQKLIQLHTLQQQQQQVQPSKHLNQTPVIPTTGKLLNQVQQAQITILPQVGPQKAVAEDMESNTITLHKSPEAESPLPPQYNGLTQVPSSNSTNSNHVPFRILKIATTTTTHLQDAGQNGLDLANIPQIQIPENNNTAFHVGENESSQGSKTFPVPTNNDVNQMEHSWLLKINEAPAVDSKKSVVKEYTNFFENFGSAERQEEQNKPLPTTKPRKGFKSQMVDDVLEILIRNGELPASAAQEPSTPTTPGKSPRVLPYPTPTSSRVTECSSTAVNPPPPPPPLPPPTFALTLPTSITFSRSPAAANQSAQNALTKEAQDILKISQDLSNFGRAHAQALQAHAQDHVEDDSSTLAMLLDEVQKDMTLPDDMELEDGAGQHGKHSELLEELETFLPSDLDVAMPMEMDYSDWLEHLLPDQPSSSSEESLGDGSQGGHMASLLVNDPNANHSDSPPNPNYYGLLMDLEGFESSRDPLLSSRSLNIFSSVAENDTIMSGVKAPHRSPSPMAMGDNLWDFV